MAYLFKNNVTTTLNEPGGVATGDLVITVDDGSVFPIPGTDTVRATVKRLSDNALEIVDITNIATNDLTIVRAREGTTALTFADGDEIEMRVTKEMFESFGQKGEEATWTKGQRGSITALTDGATITPDMADSNFFSVTLAGNRTLANPTNLTAGQSGSIFITQDATGSRTLAYGSQWDFAGGTAPTLSSAANTVDRLDYLVRTTGSIHAQLTKAWS